MCGVAGIIDIEARREIDRDALKRMTGALAHRGPDGEGFFIEPGAGLGHRRLAVIDRQGGAQPFKARSGESVLSFNGEIYNFESLARALEAEGAGLRTRSDTEVLAEGLDRRGAGFIESLRGMFAFASWDIAGERLLLARDRLGEKPLYYAQTADGFLLFASEAPALAASGLIALDFDPRALADYFFYGFVPDPKSVYRGVSKLPAGATLSVRRGRDVRVERYWTPQLTSLGGGNFAQEAERLSSLLDEAVRLQTIADAPLGAFLSGGLDSAAVVASMARAGGRVKTCTLGFPGDGHDERPFAEEIAAHLGADHVDDAAPEGGAGLVDAVARAFGEPFADSGALASFRVGELARRRVTVALSGDGGDELFAGYRRHRFHVAEARLRAAAPAALRAPVFAAAGAAYPKLDWAPRPMRLRTTLLALAESDARGYARAMAANLPERMARLLSPDFTAGLDGYDPAALLDPYFAEPDEPALLAAQRADLCFWLPGRMLTKLDRMSMIHSLEARAPFLDHKLVEWAGRLDPAFKLKDGEGKRVLKAAMAPRLPAASLARPKQGFAPPIAAWLRAGDGPLERFEASRAWRESGLFDEGAVARFSAEHRKGRSDHAQELWTLIMFDAFMRTAAKAGEAA